MSQLGHYVNRRNVQAAVSQVWPIFFGGRLLAPGRSLIALFLDIEVCVNRS